jgi:gas vesicle protein
MSRSRFFEGIFLGVIIGAIISYFFGDSIEDFAEEKIESVKEAAGVSDNPEEAVEKTLSAIEQGFDKLSQVLEDRKKG